MHQCVHQCNTVKRKLFSARFDTRRDKQVRLDYYIITMMVDKKKEKCQPNEEQEGEVRRKGKKGNEWESIGSLCLSFIILYKE